MLIKIPDENPTKKTSEQMVAGDTIYIDLTRTQIENNLPYTIPANSPVHIEAKITSNNWVETLTGRSSSNNVVAYYNGTSK